MKSVLSVFGTRPEFLKLAPVMMELRERPTFVAKALFTGQHEMQNLGYPDFPELTLPDRVDQIRNPHWSLSDLYSSLIVSISKYLSQARPDMILVHGDTATTFAAAMSGFLNGIPVAHVEAGLRTHNLSEPFPEEANRQLVSRIATLNFCPTKGSVDNLVSEGIENSRIFQTGNTIVDSVNFLVGRLESNTPYLEGVVLSLREKGISWREGDQLVLATAHRRENQGPAFEAICEAIRSSAIENPAVLFIFAAHPNPALQARALTVLGTVPNVVISRPLAYSELIFIMSKARLVVTDSGGIQEEAVSLGKPVLVTRNVTERPEGISTGLLTIVGVDKTKIIHGVRKGLSEKISLNILLNPYGDGKASKKIVDEVEKFLEKARG